MKLRLLCFIAIVLLCFSAAAFASPHSAYIERNNFGGTGFPVTNTGYFITAQHVVGEQPFVTVYYGDGFGYTGKVVAKDYEHDLALIKINANIQEYYSFEYKVEASYTMYGYPVNMRNASVSGQAIGMEGMYVQLRGKTCHGHSGAPVVDADTGLVIGMLDRGVTTDEKGECGTTSEAVASIFIVEFLHSNGVI